MKSTVAAVGLLASLASASAHQPRHFHWRRDNSTDTAAGGFTTLTVQVTEVATVTSCAPTITNCPVRSATLSASDLHTYVVTNTVVLTEIICPVTEAASISKSLIDQHATGGLPGSTLTAPAVITPTAAPSVPLNTAGVTKSAQDAAVTSPPTTGGNGESDDEDDCPADEGDVVTTVTHIISTKTLTMTVGKGSTASVVTTAIPTTIESTILVTKPAAAATKPAGVTAGGVDAAATEEPTTTVTATSTNTRTVTVKRPNPTGAGSPGSGSDTGLGAGGECSCPAVTVTVPASTVYVTIGSPAPTAAAPASGVTSSAPAAAAVTGGASTGGESNTGGQDSEEEEDDDECPAEDDVVTLSTTVTVAPYPTNGTASAGAAKPTGHSKRSNKLF